MDEWLKTEGYASTDRAGGSSETFGVVPGPVSERYQGALLGLALGDALTTTLEFKRRGTFSPVVV